MTDRTLSRVTAVALAVILCAGLLASAFAVFYGLWHGDWRAVALGCVGAVGWSWVTIFVFGGDE